MIPYNTAIVLAGTSLLGAGSGLIGTFALLRRRALLGDTLAHAALPGLCLGFLVWGDRSLPVMLVGGLISGVAGIGAVALLRRYTRIKDDAALGLVLSLFFGAGLALLKYIQTHAVGGSRAGIDHYIFGSAAGMIASDVKLIAAVAAVSLLSVLLLYKEFRLVTFDAAFARVQGWPASLIDFLLMLLVSITVIIALPAAGVVLTAALLILPAVAARFWTQWLAGMLVLSALFGALIGAAGTLASARGAGLPTGPMIVLAGAVVFLVTMLFARQRGLIARALAERRSRRRVDEQKLLLAAYSIAATPAQPSFTFDALLITMTLSAGRLRGSLQRAESARLTERTGSDTWRLTVAGLRRADAVARAYRLWRRFLTDYPDSVSLFADLDVERIDEHLPGEMVAELESKLRVAGELP
ncbi:MAG TPA: iron chelate uptake ABC transporter family permease subunit [Pirellulales bacterium]|jgi:manganese/zinc/iron transport system permease protein|nr:iron chelate uptake ABC transporter family permease subunit [Pirellulales bacterium]